MAEMTAEAILARLSDDAYAKKIGSMIDEFHHTMKGLKASELVTDQLYQDMFEALVQYTIMVHSPHDLALVCFMLGVYLAKKGGAILPTEIN